MLRVLFWLCVTLTTVALISRRGAESVMIRWDEMSHEEQCEYSFYAYYHNDQVLRQRHVQETPYAQWNIANFLVYECGGVIPAKILGNTEFQRVWEDIAVLGTQQPPRAPSPPPAFNLVLKAGFTYISFLRAFARSV